MDHAYQAATARDGMSQLWVSLESQPGEHGHHRNAHRLDTSIRHANVSHPTTKACLPRVEHVRFIPPCLRCRCRDCPAHPQTATRQYNLKSPRGGPKEGRRPPGLPPLPPPQTSPHNPSTLCWQARARDGRAGGGGTVTQPRGWPTGVGPPYSSPGQSDPPRVQRCRCRLFRQRAVSATPSNSALPSLGSSKGVV